MAVTLQPVGEAELAALHALEQQGQLHPMSINQLGSCLGGRYFALGAYCDDILQGFAIAETVVDEGTLIDIVVAPAARRQGLAKRLIEALIERWQGQGVASVFLEVRASNLGAQALYDQLGFNTIGVRHGYYPAAGGREDAVLMALALSL